MKKFTSLFFLLVACVCFAQKPPTSPITFTPAKQLFKVVKNPNLTKEQQFRYDKILDRAEHDYMEVVEMDYLPNYIVPKTQALKLKVPALRHVQFPKLRSAQENIVLKAIRNEARTGNFNGNDNYVFYGAANPTISILTGAANPTISINTGGVVLPPNFPCPPFCITDNTDSQTNDVEAECRYADMTVIQSDNGSYGMIKIDQLAFQLFNLTDGLYALAKVSDDVMDEESYCGLEEIKSKQNDFYKMEFENFKFDEVVVSTLQKSTESIIDLGVMFTPLVTNSYPDIEERIDIATENANNALINSEITGVSFNVVAISEFDDSSLTGNAIESDLGYFSNDPSVSCFRDTYGADLMILLTGSVYNTYHGLAQIGPDINMIHAIVRTSSMLEVRHTFAHEIGHMLGCAHQTSFNQLYEPYARALLFDVEAACGALDLVGTVLGSSGLMNYRVLQFSNPDVFYGLNATGTPDNDNSRRIEETAPIVANFRNGSTAPGNLSIENWPNTTCPCDYTFYYSAPDISNYFWTLAEEIAPGTGIYSPIFNSTNSSFTLNEYAFCSASTNYRVELSAYYNSGVCEEYFFIGPVFHATGTIPSGPCQILLKKDENESSTAIMGLQENIIVYPNPASDVINVVLPEDLLEKNVELRLNNLSGQQMASIQIHDLQTLNQQLSFNQYNLANGIYILEVESDGKLMVEKVSVIR